MNSVEKLSGSLKRVEEIAADKDTPPTARMAASTLMILSPRLLAMLPQEPTALDELLEKLAGWALEQRSDPPEQVTA